jgi:acylpyruvate hydrolase
MRLATLVVAGRTVLAARRGAQFVLLEKAAPALPTELGALLAQGVDVRALMAALERAPQDALIDEASAVFAPPIASGARVFCLGLNYVEHAAEAKYDKPQYPVVFSRFAESFVGHGVPLELPRVSTRFDYEAELVVVIGRGGRHLSKADALSHVAAYTLMNDGSVRDFQTRSPQWMLGKNFDRSGSLGPELVTADELPPGATGLTLTGRLNGEVMQQANTNQMIFDVATVIASLSEAIALKPGDLIASGTPSGVGNARSPQVFLKAGDVFEVEVERVGTLRNVVRPEAV